MDANIPTESNRSLRAAEAVALAATTLAVGLTALLEPASAAVESNPAARLLLAQLGWTGAGVLAIVGEALLFAGWRRLANRGYPTAALTAGCGIAIVGVADVLANLWVLSRLGIPETIRLVTYGTPTVLVGLTACLVILRVPTRAIARIRLIDRGLLKRTAEVAGIVLVAGAVVLATFSGGISVVPSATQDVEAAGGTLFDGVEDGDVSEWDIDTGFKTFTASKTAAFDGDYGIKAESDGNTDTSYANLSFTSSSYNQVSHYLNVQSGCDFTEVANWTSGSSNVIRYELTDTCEFRLQTGSNTNTGITINKQQWYKIEIQNIDYSANTYDFVVKDVNGNTIGSYTGASFENGASSLDGVGIYEDNSQYTRYYDVFAADGYTLSSSITGTVVDQTGAPVANATVVATKYERNNFTGTAEEINETIDNIQANISDPTPDSFDKGRQLAGAGGYYRSVDGEYVAPHTAANWRLLALEDSNIGTIVGPDPALSQPTLVYAESETPVLSLWSSDAGNVLEDRADEDLPGGTTAGNISVAKLGPGGSELWVKSIETGPMYRETSPGNLGVPGSDGVVSKTHESVILQGADTGFYRVHPEGEPGKAITFAIAPGGSIEKLKTSIRTDLKDRKGNLENRSQYIQDRDGANELGTERVVTDSNGDFSLSTTADEVQLSAVGAGSIDTDTAASNRTLQSQREAFNDEVDRLTDKKLTAEPLTETTCDEAFQQLGAAYQPAGVTTVDVPESNVTVEVVRADAPEAADPFKRACQQNSKTNALFNNSLAFLTGAYNNVTSLANDTLASYIERGADLPATNAEICVAYNEAAENENYEECLGTPSDDDGDGYIGGNESSPGVPTGEVTICQDGTIDCSDGADYTREQAEAAQEYAEQSTDNAGDTIDSGTPDTDTGVGGDGDGDVPDPTDATDPNQPLNNTGNGTVSGEWPFETDLGSDDAEVVVTIEPGNGDPPIVLNSSSAYVTVESRIAQPDLVRLEDYPLDNDTAVAEVSASVATPDNTAKESTTVRNPQYAGEVPELQAIQLSTSTPGPDQIVEVTPRGDGAAFGSLVSAQALAPNGTELETTLDGDTAEFTTAGEGVHKVRLTVSNDAGRNFTTAVRVGAEDRPIDRPPTVRARTGPLGLFSIASDGLRSADIEVREGGSEVSAAAILESDADTPARLHVHEQSVDAAPTHTTTVRLLQGPDEQAVDDRTTVVLHSASVSDTGIVYANGRPLPRDGSNEYGATNYSDAGLNVEAISDASGVARIEIQNDPGLIQRALYQARLNLPFLFTVGGGPSGMAVGGGLSTGLLTTAGAAWLLGRRNRGGRA